MYSKAIIDIITNVTSYLFNNPFEVPIKFRWEYDEYRIKDKYYIELNYQLSNAIDMWDCYILNNDISDIDIERITWYFINNYNNIVNNYNE